MDVQAIANSLDGIIDTVSAKHPLSAYLATLKVGGDIVMVGVPDEPMELPQGDIIMREFPVCGTLACCSTIFIMQQTFIRQKSIDTAPSFSSAWCAWHLAC